MADYFAIVIGLVLVNQFMLARAPATTPFPLHIAELRSTTMRLVAITAVVACSAVVASLLDRLLIDAFDLDAWRITIFVLLVVGLGQLAEALLAPAGQAADRNPQAGLPLVTINTPDHSDTAALGVDNYGGAVAMMEHLVASGRRRIAFIAGPEKNTDALERLQ